MENRRLLLATGGLLVVTVREDREVSGPPSMALAALATAGENLGYAVRDVRKESGLLLMSSWPRMTGATLGFLVTARVRRRRQGSLLSVDVTPVLGSWAVHSAREELNRLIREYQVVLEAPKARIRPPEKRSPGGRPFGYLPEILAGAWGVLTVLVYGVGIGGWWWTVAAASVAGAVMIANPLTEDWWSWTVTGLVLLSLPFSVLGAVARRLALAGTYWQGMLDT